MEEDTLDQVLRACKAPSEALKSSPNVLQDALSCSICNGLMLEPYTVHCGHTFCRACLSRWIKECHANSTCPQCREPIIAEPALSLVIRELALAAVASWNVDHPDKVVPAESLKMEEKPQFFRPGALEAPQYDSDDGVYRCPMCSFEIEEDGVCAGCGREFNRNRMIFDADYTQDDDDDDDDDHYDHDLIDDEAVDDYDYNSDWDEEQWDHSFDPRVETMADVLSARELFENAIDSRGEVNMALLETEGARGSPEENARFRNRWNRWAQQHREHREQLRRAPSGSYLQSRSFQRGSAQGSAHSRLAHPRPRTVQISDDDSSMDSFIDDDNDQDNSMDSSSDLDSSQQARSESDGSQSDGSDSGSAADTSDDSLLEELHHRDVVDDSDDDDVQITSVRQRKNVIDDE